MKNTTRKGTAWTTKVRRLLEGRGLTVQGRPWLAPGDDLQVMSHRLSIEAKDHRSYRLGDWVDQAVAQAPAHLIPVVWAHRNGHSTPEDGFVILTGRDFLDLLLGRD